MLEKGLESEPLSSLSWFLLQDACELEAACNIYTKACIENVTQARSVQMRIIIGNHKSSYHRHQARVSTNSVVEIIRCHIDVSWKTRTFPHLPDTPSRFIRPKKKSPHGKFLLLFNNLSKNSRRYEVRK